MKKVFKNNKGFTLIELMIVIAIIGILAAIAIPNFISYRDKSYCKGAESDAQNVAGRIADYFSVPARTALPNTGDLGGFAVMTNLNTYTLASTNGVITITVTDASGRCPADYRTPMTSAANPAGFWNGQTFVKNIQ